MWWFTDTVFVTGVFCLTVSFFAIAATGRGIERVVQQVKDDNLFLKIYRHPTVMELKRWEDYMTRALWIGGILSLIACYLIVVSVGVYFDSTAGFLNPKIKEYGIVDAISGFGLGYFLSVFICWYIDDDWVKQRVSKLNVEMRKASVDSLDNLKKETSATILDIRWKPTRWKVEEEVPGVTTRLTPIINTGVERDNVYGLTAKDHLLLPSELILLRKLYRWSYLFTVTIKRKGEEEKEVGILIHSIFKLSTPVTPADLATMWFSRIECIFKDISNAEVLEIKFVSCFDKPHERPLSSVIRYDASPTGDTSFPIPYEKVTVAVD